MTSSTPSEATQTFEVPGRICLFGDKTDLAGLPVIAATITCTLKLYIKALPGSRRVRMFSDNFNSGLEYELGQKGDFTHPLKYWCAVVYLLREKMSCGIDARISSSLPMGKGLASSGAVSVAMVKALDSLFHIGLTSAETAELAYEAEHDVLGIPCGRMDQYAIAYGGVTLITTGDEQHGAQPLNVKSLHVVVGDTLEPRPLHTLLHQFKRKLADKDPVVMDAFQQVEKCLYGGKEALERGDLASVGKFMSAQMEQENRMGVATDKLNELCRVSVGAGAYGAKLMGAGGGGCMVALCPADKQLAVAKAMENAGGRPIILELMVYPK
eukprot:TRINITY_DN16965_c0_g1_i1.p1 TRINITY_DN16965_c0_g1~~TRINITY_DN16965_c0_g1_i1.p1  ORF type:complete len:326 (-),score=108.15 TRINITY_DN16965_c0_g1_i1:63-1040(-)